MCSINLLRRLSDWIIKKDPILYIIESKRNKLIQKSSKKAGTEREDWLQPKYHKVAFKQA